MEPTHRTECGCDDKVSVEGNQIRVLLIDDDEDDHFLTAERLADVAGHPYRLDWTPNYDEGLNAICDGTHDVYLLDFCLGAKSGIDLLREAHDRGCSGPIILLTGQGHSRTDVEALAAGADDYLEKAGLTGALLDRAIRFALAQHRSEAELERKVEERTQELARANSALRDADRRKDEFLATLAHELRNPLAPIRNALEIMRLVGESGETNRRQRERIERQVTHLQRLIEDLLDISRITRGTLRLSMEPLTIQEVVESALDASRPLIDRARLILDVDVPTQPISLLGDRVRLSQSLTNLLNNAVKFTEPGGLIRLTVTPADDQVHIAVRDTGVGISPDELPRIFTLFTQVDRSQNRSQGGLGIGLCLVRRLVEMHDGSVVAHSDGLGTGSTFTVSLPTTVNG